MKNTGIIYIPDISGFTKFVTQTEIAHSNHIITELIEVILESNDLELNISEIEGDAVLFYKLGNPPKLSEVISQTKNTFINFHSYLKIIERDRVCQCGACTGASNLTLKFIAHFGELQEVNIKNFSKIMGSDVILAHRLLKTKVPETEYLLYTEEFGKIGEDIDKPEKWIKEKEYCENFTNFGDVNSKYINLSELRNSLPDTPAISTKREVIGPTDIKITIDAPLLFVHSILIDNEQKWEYVGGLKDVKNSSKINRVSSSHTCVFDDLEVHFVTMRNETNKNEIKYTERADPGFGFTIINDFRLRELNGKTELSLTLIKEPDNSNNKNFLLKLFETVKSKIIIKKITANTNKALESFKKYSERKYKKEKSEQNSQS